MNLIAFCNHFELLNDIAVPEFDKIFLIFIMKERSDYITISNYDFCGEIYEDLKESLTLLA